MENLLIKRFCATVLDIAVVSIPAGVVYLIVELLKKTELIQGTFSELSVFTELSVIYLILFIGYDYGYMRKFRTTIGKNKFHIHAETDRGKKRIPKKIVFIRSLCKAISLFTLYSIPAVLSLLIMTTDYGTSIHDKIARTRVWENTTG